MVNTWDNPDVRYFWWSDREKESDSVQTRTKHAHGVSYVFVEKKVENGKQV